MDRCRAPSGPVGCLQATAGPGPWVPGLPAGPATSLGPPHTDTGLSASWKGAFLSGKPSEAETLRFRPTRPRGSRRNQRHLPPIYRMADPFPGGFPPAGVASMHLGGMVGGMIAGEGAGLPEPLRSVASPRGFEPRLPA